MIKLREIIDTWNMIEKHDVQGWKMHKGVILIPKSEYLRVLDTTPHKKYYLGLRA